MCAAGRSVLVVLAIVLVFLSTEPSALAGNVTVTDVRELAGACEVYLQAYTERFWTVIARVVEDTWSDTTAGPLVSAEQVPIDDAQLNDDPMVEAGREGRGGVHVYWLLRRLSRTPHP